MSLTITFQNANVNKRSLSDLQLLLTYCHLTAHNSRETSQAAYARMIDYLDRYAGGARKPPFEIIKKIIADGKLDEFVRKGLKVSRPANRKEFFKSAVESSLDLRTASRDDIEAKITGIGPEKASLFVLYRDKGWKGAVIDIDVQKWLREEFAALNSVTAQMVPTRPARTIHDYVKIERMFLELAEAKKVDPWQLNLEVLQKFSPATRFDEAEAQRIKAGGNPAESHWNSRPSDKNISLGVA